MNLPDPTEDGVEWAYKPILFLKVEPLSTILSIIGIFVHFRLMRRYVHKIHPFSPSSRYRYPYGIYWTFSLGLWVISMAFSAAYHASHSTLMEALDLHFGTLTFLLIFAGSIIRAFEVTSEKAAAAVVAVVLILFAENAFFSEAGFITAKMAVRVRIAVALSMSAVWLVWGARRVERPYTRQLHLLQAIGWVFVLVFKLQKFPPVGGYIDANALWHLSSLFFASRCVKFLVADSAWVQKYGDCAGILIDKKTE